MGTMGKCQLGFRGAARRESRAIASHSPLCHSNHKDAGQVERHAGRDEGIFVAEAASGPCSKVHVTWGR